MFYGQGLSEIHYLLSEWKESNRNLRSGIGKQEFREGFLASINGHSLKFEWMVQLFPGLFIKAMLSHNDDIQP